MLIDFKHSLYYSKEESLNGFSDRLPLNMKRKKYGFVKFGVMCVLLASLGCFSACDISFDFPWQSEDDNSSQSESKDPSQSESKDPSQSESKDPSPSESKDPSPSPTDGLPERYTAEADKIVNFAGGDSKLFQRANGYSNGNMFNCTWSSGNALISEGLMNMSVTKDNNSGIFYGAEYRSNKKYSYGFYSVSMKAAKCSGVVSSFFTYTNGPWDEIDIEFLGNKTTKVQFNYYTNGVGGHEHLYDLGFDASAGFHEYAFDWQKDCIIWYVDGKPVYKATKDIPSNAGQIMMNVWNGIGVDEWIGAFDQSKLPVTAQYQWIGYKKG